MAFSPLAVRLLERATTRKFSTHAVLFHQGAPARGAFVVGSGCVRLVLLGAAGEPIWSRVEGPGAILGLPSSISGRSYSMTAIALEPSTAAYVPRADLECLAANDAVASREILNRLSEEVFDVRRKLALLKGAAPVIPHGATGAAFNQST